MLAVHNEYSQSFLQDYHREKGKGVKEGDKVGTFWRNLLFIVCGVSCAVLGKEKKRKKKGEGYGCGFSYLSQALTVD